VADDRVSILHIFPSFSIGGQQRRLATLAGALGASFSHKILSLDGDISASALFGERAPAVEPFVLEKSRFVTLRNITRLRRAIKESGADLLCTYNFGSIEAVIANRTGPRLAHIHHEDGFGQDEAQGRQKWRRVLARRVILSASTTVVPSRGLEAIAVKKWKLKAGRVVRIPVGVDSEKFSRERTVHTGPIVVGSIGNMRPEKNFARLIRCFETASEGRDARLAIYGDGPERPALLEMAAQSKAGSQIALPGATNSVAETLATFDIFAISSDTEQMPTSLLEAMAAGLAAVAVAVGEIPSMIDGEGCDFVVGRDDEALFAMRLRQLIDDTALRRRLGEANRRRAYTFGVDAMSDAFRRLYAGAAGGGY
jgi:glycosyltransferase involved in cell wall biosynthesis